MSNNSQSLNSVTPSDDSHIDTPEKRLLLQSLTQKMLNRVFEINLNTPYAVSFEASGRREVGHISLDLYWFVPDDNGLKRPISVNTFCSLWMSSEDISRWFRDANIGLDLLIANSKAA